MFDVKKVQSKAGGLYDVLNGLFIDFSLRPAPYSELPLAFSHLYRSQSIFKGKDVIYLADRYYGSAEIISTLSVLIIIISSEEKAISIRSRLRS